MYTKLKCDHTITIANDRLSKIDNDGYCHLCGEFVPIDYRPPRYQTFVNAYGWVDISKNTPNINKFDSIEKLSKMGYSY